MKYSKLAFAVSVAISSNSQAATFTVSDTSISANGAGSFFQAIKDSNSTVGEDTIVFDSSIAGQTVPLRGNFLVLDSVTIDGESNNITMLHNSESSLLNVSNSRDIALTLKNVTVTTDSGPAGSIVKSETSTNNHAITLDNIKVTHDANATSAQDSALFVAQGDLTVKDSTFTAVDSTVLGSVIRMRGGTLNIDRSAFDANTSSLQGGAIALDSGAANIAATITNSSFTRNNAQLGGAIYAYDNNVGRTFSINIEQTTITDNNANSGHGGGIYTTQDESSGVDINLKNALIANNTGEGSIKDLYSSTPSKVTTANSLVEIASSGISTTATNSSFGEDPNLDTTIDTNQAIAHYPLKSGSLVVNTGDQDIVTSEGDTDILGNPRISGCKMDMGAIEFQQPIPAPVPVLKDSAQTSYEIAVADQDLTIQLSDLYQDTGLTFQVESINGASSLPSSFNLNATGQLILSVTADELNQKLPLTLKVTATNTSTCASTETNITINKGATAASSSSAISPWLTLLLGLPFAARLRNRK